MSQLADLAARLWDDLAARPSGPLAFRFYLQPTMAAVAALRDGWKDAVGGRSPYLWTILHDPSRRMSRLREGFHAVARVLLLGVVMESIYQFMVLKAFRPVEMLDIVLLLAFVPYLLLRGPAGRIARWWRARSETGVNKPSFHDN